MASKKTGHREPPKQIIIEKFMQILTQEFGESAIQILTQEFGESASRKTQLDSSDQSPGTSSNWFKKQEKIDKITTSVNEAPTSAGKRICSVGIDEQHDSDVKKARRQSITDPELRYRCSFCSQRFPSLTNVRDHTRACHREENERRKEERLNTSAKATVHKNVEPEVRPKLTKNPESHIHLFRCIACKFASVSYDHMIEHCQNHVIKFENPEANIQCDVSKKYVICGEKFNIDFDTYSECADGLNNSYTFINCDYNLLKHDKWPGIFTNLPKSEIDKINCTSIYYFTRIIRLTSQKKPASVPFMVFQCKKCMKCIDPQSILAHVQENSCNEKNADYPCHICKRPFLNENTMYLHHKRHKAADNLNLNFTKVLFNNYDDDSLNAVLLKAAGYTMNIVPCKTTQKGLSTDFANIRTEVKNSQTIEKPAVDIQSAPSGSKTVIVSHAADKKMLFKCDARSMIIQGTKTGGVAQSKTISEITSTVTKEVDKIDTVYKCKCELCFHGLEFLLKHLEICHSDSKSTIISCMCGLLFNEQQYQIHYGIHSQGFTKLNVKKIIVFDEEIVVLTNKYNSHVDIEIKQIEYNELCRKAIAKLVYTLQNVALAHVKGYKKEEFIKQKIIAAAATRSVSSATDDLMKSNLKTQGTMTDIPNYEVNKDSNKYQASNTKSVGSGTDDLNTTVIKSPGTMTTPERQSIYMVNKGVDTINKVCLTKTFGTGTDNLNITVMKSQGTMNLPETQTVQKVNKGVDNIIQVSQTKSVVSGTDDLNMSVVRSQGTINTPVTQTVHEVNKDLGNTEEGKPNSSLTRTHDLNILLLKAQEANEANVEITNTVKSAADNLVKFKRIINDINIKYNKLNKKIYSGSDYTEENQLMVESTLEAENNEITKDKTKVNCDTESTESKKESGNISTTKYEECNKTIIKECDKIEIVHTNKNLEVKTIGQQAEKNNTIEKIMDRNELEKDTDNKTADGNAESKIYTEDELLSEPEMPIYFDAEESILTDDEDPILLYEDDVD